MRCQAVVGMGFGDCGKGKVVSALATRTEKTLVVRYCGGPQAGHHVVLKDGTHHVFSHFGSGTLQKKDTYWSPYCTVDPIGLMNEMDDLIKIGTRPTLFIHRDCPVTTPYEKVYNRRADKMNRHGSCGIGIGQTLQRQEDRFSIKMVDLFHPTALRIKLRMLREHYYFDGDDVAVDEFLGACEEVVHSESIVPVNVLPSSIFKYDNIIFEGSQGLLLDQDIGFFPHVTRGNTGTKNITEMGFEPEYFLVTRAYQTRHGNGPMTNEEKLFNVPDNLYENNFNHTFQGSFRRTLLDIDLLEYAIDSDYRLRYRTGLSLVITCLDLMEENYVFTSGRNIWRLDNERDFVKMIKTTLKIPKVYLSRTPYPELELFCE